MPKNRVLIYRDRLLPLSETFIRQHIDSLIEFEPMVAGLRHVEGINMDDLSPLLLEDSHRSLTKIAKFKLYGNAPLFEQSIRKFKPDLIHAHFAVDAVDMLPVAQKLGVPLIVTLHGYDVNWEDATFRRSGPVGWNFLAKRKRLQKHGARFLSVSDFIKRRALAQGFPESRTLVHYLGMDLTAFDRPRQPSRIPNVLFVGRLVEKKGLSFLIEAMSALPDTMRDTELRIVGDGPERPKCEALARKYRINATFLGAQPHGRVIEELSRSYVFCMPSIPASTGDNEGLGITIMEAQAMGVPVVSFAQGAILEAVIPNVTGSLVPVFDTHALSAALSTLLGDADLRIHLGENAKTHVARTFDIQHQARKLETIYKDVIQGKNPS